MKQSITRALMLVTGVVFVIGMTGMNENAIFPSWQKHIKAFYSKVQHAGKEDRIPGNWYFYMQRTYGNPGINVDEMMLKASRDVDILRNSTFRKSAAETTQWYALGPANIGGRMRAIAFHPTNTDIVYAGAPSGGVFKSTDATTNTTWKPVMDFAPALAVAAITLDPNNPDIVFAGTGEPTAQTPLSFSSPSYYGVGIMKSTDAGNSWVQLPWITSSVAVQKIIVSPVSNDTILAATTNGLYKTKNSGEAWTRVLSGNITDLDSQPGNPHVLYAAVGNDDGDPTNGFYKSFGNGVDTTWVKVDGNWPDATDMGRILLATTPADPNLVVAMVSRAMNGYSPVDNDFVAVMKSTDAGETWEQINVTGITETNFGRGQLFYDFCFTISPTDPDLMFAGGFELWRSSNGGARWSLSARGSQVHVDHHFIEFQPNTGYLWNGNDGGIYVNTNPEFTNTWQNKEATLETIQYYTIAADPNVPWRIYGGTQDNGTHKLTVKSQKIWDDNVNGGDGGYVLIARENSNIFFTNITVYKQPYRTINGGATQTRLTDGLGGTDEHEYFNWITPMTLVYPSSDNNKSQLYTGSQYMYVADDATNTSIKPGFQLLSDMELVRGGSYESVITTMAVAPSNPDYMYVGSGDAGIFRTRNLQDGPGAVGFENVTIQTKPRWVTRVAVDPRNEHIVYATYSGYRAGHVWRSTNDGTNWTDISSNLPDIPVNSIKVHPVYSNILFIASDAGVWYSTNTGDSWQLFGEGLPTVVTSDLDYVVDNGTTYIVAATYGRGMWYAEMPEFTVGTDDIPLASTLLLGNSYPNPVQSGVDAVIRFTTPEAQDVILNLYDVQGRKVKTLYDARSAAGTNTVNIGTTGLSPGIYFYRMTAGNDVLTRKMIISS